MMFNLRLQEMLKEYERITQQIPEVLEPLMSPYIARVQEAIKPGINTLTWTSLNIADCKNMHWFGNYIIEQQKIYWISGSV